MKYALCLAALTIAPASAQDHGACHGIYCPQTKVADYAAEFAPYVAADKTWEQVKGQSLLVMKYYDLNGTLVSTKTFPQTSYMEPVNNLPGEAGQGTPPAKRDGVDGRGKIAFAGQGTPTIVLYGLVPCTKTGTFEFKGEKFTCETLWQDRLHTNLYATQAVICRAYSNQIGKPVQEATCLRSDEGYGTGKRGADVIDDRLVGLGIATIAKDASGQPLRPDLATVAAKGAKIFEGITSP